MADLKKIRVKQIRSTAGRTKRTRDTLKALGLGRIGKTKELPVNDCVIGMVKAVRHLIEVKSA